MLRANTFLPVFSMIMLLFAEAVYPESLTNGHQKDMLTDSAVSSNMRDPETIEPDLDKLIFEAETQGFGTPAATDSPLPSQSTVKGRTAQKEMIPEKYFFVTAEAGAGHYLYAGAGYDVGRKLRLFKSRQYFKSAGLLAGFTCFDQDSISVWEPSLFFTGEIINNRIKIRSRYNIDIDWRLKIGRLYVRSAEYDATGSAFTMGLDFLFRIFRYFYLDISVPFISGSEGSEITPCVGAGVEYRLF